MIDRFSRWPEAIPIENMEALTVCRAFGDHWISRYGASETLTTDQGSQFESQLFTALLQLTGCQRIPTTAYHPASYGIIKRWHSCLKAAIMCNADSNFARTVSTVLLGLQTNVMDIGSSPAEFLYGSTLRIPGEFVIPDDFTPNRQAFLEEFREHMRSIKPVPVGHHHKNRAFLHQDIGSCTHVFLPVGTGKKSLEGPCTGPHKVINRTSDRIFEIEINGSPRRVSVEIVKPAHFLRDDNVIRAPSSTNEKTVPNISLKTATNVVPTFLDNASNLVAPLKI